MSTSQIPEQLKNGQEPSGTSPSPAAPTSTAPEPVKPEPFRYGDTAPAWARGKTAEEVLGIATNLNATVEGFIQNGSRAQAQQPQQPQYQAPPAQQPQFDPEGYLQRKDIETLAPQFISQAVAPQFAQMHQSIAQANLNQVQRDNAVIFQKYGPELNSYLAKVPFEQRSVDNLTTIVDIVRGKHVEELGREIAGRLVADMGSELRSTGSPMPSAAPAEPKYTLKSDSLPEDWKDRAAKMGLTESAVDEWCRANEITRADFFKQFGQTVITERRA